LQAPPIQVVREPHATPAAAGMNQNAFGTRDTGAPKPDSSARAPVDTPSELVDAPNELVKDAPFGYFKSGARKGQPRTSPTPVRRPRPDIRYDIEDSAATLELMPQGRTARMAQGESLFDKVTGMKRA
jgi:hypothetical protein